MATDFDALFAATAGPQLADVFGDALTYTPPGGAAVAIPDARWVDEDPRDSVVHGTDSEQPRAALVVAAAAVAAPVRLALVVRGGVTWTVDLVVPLAGAEFRLDLVRAVVREQGGRDRRIRR